MFVILNIVNSGKKKIRKGQSVKSVNEFGTGRGERFYIVDVFDSENGVNWDDVAAFLGRHALHVLSANNLPSEGCCTMRRFNSNKFRNILLFNTMNIVLKELYLSGFRTKCYVNDRKGVYSFLLPGVVRYSAETVVLTDSEYRYFSQIQSLYDNMGAGVTITDTAAETESHALIIDTDNTFLYNGNGILFSPFCGIMPGVADGFDDIKALCPCYIDVTDFLAAVYEMNREKRLASAFCRTLRRGDEEFSVYELIQELKLRISSSPDRRKSIIFYV